MVRINLNPKLSHQELDIDSYSILNGVITQEDNVYCSLCLELDVASEGESVEEAKRNLEEAVKEYIEIAMEMNIPVFRPVPATENPILNGEKIIERFKMETSYEIFEYA
jgi:predicted RNase H-like HicB family nuclease